MILVSMQGTSSELRMRWMRWRLKERHAGGTWHCLGGLHVSSVICHLATPSTAFIILIVGRDLNSIAEVIEFAKLNLDRHPVTDKTIYVA